MDDDRLRVEFMDTVFRDADRDDVDYYLDRATAVDGPVLKLGYGTGQIYLELLDAGVDDDSIDLSAAALPLLRDCADERGLDPTVWQADMTKLSTDREYALVTCPFNAIQEVTTIAQQQALFEAVYDALVNSSCSPAVAVPLVGGDRRLHRRGTLRRSLGTGLVARTDGRARRRVSHPRVGE